jgi:hypothetical protein
MERAGSDRPGWLTSPAFSIKYGFSIFDIVWREIMPHRIDGVLGGSTILSQAYSILRIVAEVQKPDEDREQACQERNLPRIKQGIQLAERGRVFATDKFSGATHIIKEMGLR